MYLKLLTLEKVNVAELCEVIKGCASMISCTGSSCCLLKVTNSLPVPSFGLNRSVRAATFE